MHQAALPHIKRSLSQGDRRSELGLRVRTATYFSTGMSFKLEIVRGGRWHTKLSNFFSADVYSDKQIGRSTHRDLVMWGSERCIIAEKETLKRGEVGVPACPARDTPLDHPSKSGCWGTSAFPSECFGSGCFLGHGHFLLGRAKMEKHGRLEGP